MFDQNLSYCHILKQVMVLVSHGHQYRIQSTSSKEHL